MTVMIFDLSGMWKCDIEDGTDYEIKLPGTLDESAIGHSDTEDNDTDKGTILTRLTRKHTFEGTASFSKRIDIEIPARKRIFLECERARVLGLKIDGRAVPEFEESSLASRHVFEITNYYRKGSEITLLSDNHYDNMPRRDITYSSMATDETQTNWNGILGHFRIRSEELIFAHSVRCYPYQSDGKKLLRVVVTANSDRNYCGNIVLTSEAFEGKEQISMRVNLIPGQNEIILDDLVLREDAMLWDLDEGNLYKLRCGIDDFSEKEISFGVRFWGEDDGRLSLNGRKIFLRSEANCGEFPETGYPPMYKENWLEIMSRYQSYGVNCVRFHSHCPPEAAFEAADELGILMQPELSNWNPENAFETDESYEYYKRELKSEILMLANHPSFVMLTLGNELHCAETGHERMNKLLDMAKELDSTRLYANGSNVHYGEIGCDKESDFYTSMRFRDKDLRGTFDGMNGYINNHYPSATGNYDAALELLRKEYSKPLFGFEVGQFEVLPDFHELDSFNGVTRPDNISYVKERVMERGMLEKWDSFVAATGEMSRRAYREEVEAALRTKELSGISLLGLQDFPGQGTALVGMMNSHLVPKAFDFARPEHFKSFFTDKLPLLLLPKYTYQNGEELKAKVKIANYGKTNICGRLDVRIISDEGSVLANESVCDVDIMPGELYDAGVVSFMLEGFCTSKHLTIEADVLEEAALGDEVNGNSFAVNGMVEDEPALKNRAIGKPLAVSDMVESGCRNSYDIWVYPNEEVAYPEGVYEAEKFDYTCHKIIEDGGIIYFNPSNVKEVIPSAVKTQFTTDFWSVGTFPSQEGTMGQLIDEKHPVFDGFPTDFYTGYQWWPMASKWAVEIPDRIDGVITEMDSYSKLRHMAQLFEFRCGKARILFSAMELKTILRYPEARALQNSIYRYLASEHFNPAQEMSESEIVSLFD